MIVYYLELSDESGGNAHKFYEVTVDNLTVTIKYGRIGADGSSSTQNFPTNTDADKFAQKKINEKQRKGYAPATKGVRLRRTITRRAIVSTPSTSKHYAPILWSFRTGSPAFGIYIDEKGCWVGNQKGQVFKLNHEAEVQVQYQLSEGVKCIVADDSWVYIGCDDGNVYDLSGKMPRLAYAINPSIDIFWLDIKNGLLAVSDSGGNLTTINYEDEEQWSVKTAGSSAWMVRCDAFGRIFYGDSAGVSGYYGWENGKLDWQQKTSSVLFGWYDNDHVYASTSNAKVHKFTKEGTPLQVYNADNGVFSCATSPNGTYVFAGDSCSSIYCFAESGERLWKLASGCGSAYSMQYFQEKLYIVTTDGSFACIDVSENAIKQVQEGTVFTAKTIKAPTETIAMVQSEALETAPPNAQGVILKCIEEGSKLKIKVETPGYNDWNVQFPKNIRVKDQRYLVDKIEPAAQGDFYRVLGNIYLLP
jgi:predicted DNA-binding WGR domain protein